MILAIDPGNEYSAFVIVSNDLSKVVYKGKVENDNLRHMIYEMSEKILCTFIETLHYREKISTNTYEWYCNNHDKNLDHIAIEMVASYGMPVGATVFETCVWIGRFIEMSYKLFHINPTLIYRKDEKVCLCHSMKAKDSNIRQALIDRFGVVGTKKNQGYFYGFKTDIWQAMAVAVTYHDTVLEKE